MTIRELKELLERARGFSLTEAPEEQEPAGEAGTSLDAQVDRYFSEYENEAKSAKQEGVDYRLITRSFLHEADEDAVSDNPDNKVGDDAIDIESFANSVVRLIENYDSLLEVRSTLLRRATNYLSKVYDTEVVSQFQQVMLQDHGMEAGKTRGETVASQTTAPNAIRSGGDDTGSAGT